MTKKTHIEPVGISSATTPFSFGYLPPMKKDGKTTCCDNLAGCNFVVVHDSADAQLTFQSALMKACAAQSTVATIVWEASTATGVYQYLDNHENVSAI